MSMHEIDTYIETLRALRVEAMRFVGIHDAVALNWTPTVADTNTIYQLLTHVTGSEQWWIQQIIGGVDVRRDREAEFEASGDDIAALKSRFETTAVRSEEVLAGLSDTDLSAMRESTSGSHSVRWCILHVVAHMALHIGHIELTSQLYQETVRKGA